MGGELPRGGGTRSSVMAGAWIWLITIMCLIGSVAASRDEADAAGAAWAETVKRVEWDERDDSEW